MERVDETITTLEQILESKTSLEFEFEGEVYNLERMLEEIRSPTSSIGKHFRRFFKGHLKHMKEDPDPVKYLETKVFSSDLTVIIDKSYSVNKKDDVSNLDRTKGSEKFIGRVIDSRYKIIELLDATKKSWIFSAREVGEISAGRDVALKVLKLGQEPKRKEQFLEEPKTLAGLEKHPNIVKIYGCGSDREYFYIAMEKVLGKNLNQRISDGETFSLKWKVDYIHSLAEAMDFCYSHGIEHNDIKPKNLKEREGEEGVCVVLDFGSKFTRDRDSNDVYAMGQVLKELLKHREKPNEKIPRKLEKIVDMAEEGKFVTPGDFKKALEGYRQGIINRRKFIKAGLAVVVLGGLIYGGFEYKSYEKKEQKRILDKRKLLIEHNRYLNSMDYIVDEIAKVKASDYKNIEPLFDELAVRILNNKVLLWEDIVPQGEFAFATDEGKWHTSSYVNADNGYLAGVFWEGYKRTRNERFKEIAKKRTFDIQFSSKDKKHTTAVRFFYSHAQKHKFTGEERSKENALQALDIFVERFKENDRFIAPISGMPNLSEAGTMMDIVPYLLWGYNATGNETYIDIAKSHTLFVAKSHIRKNHSVRKTVIVNPSTYEVVRELNSKGVNDNSTHSRAQAQMILGLALSSQSLQDPIILQYAEQVADYYIDEIGKIQDYIHYYDFEASSSSPKDSSAATISLPGLQILYALTGKEKYRKAEFNTKRSLSLNYLSKDTRKKGYQGLIREGCYDYPHRHYINNSLIGGDYHFIASL